VVVEMVEVLVNGAAGAVVAAVAVVVVVVEDVAVAVRIVEVD
jgi:hypothetical protein